MTDTERAVSALTAIPNDIPGDDWLRVSMGAKNAGIKFDDWHNWCKGASNYKGELDCRARWKSIDADGAVKAGTLYKTAAEHGWRIKGNAKAPVRLKQATVPPRKPAPGMGASEVFNRCQPATNSHPYLVQKGAAGVPLQALRVVSDGDPLRIMGESMAGALVVPCMASDGSLSTLQLIPPPDVVKRLKAAGKPGKLNLPGHSVQGWFTVGELVPGGLVYIVEGIGQAWAVWQATGSTAVVAFGAGNIGKVATAMRQNDDAARLVLCPDRGKEQDANKIAADIGAAVACLPECEPENFDVGDLFQREGFDVLAALLESATEPPKAEPKVHPLARFVDFDGVVKPPRWVIPGFIPADGVVSIAGAPGVGKTTALLPLAMTAAGLHGDDLMPRQWRHVVYVTEDVEQARRILAGIVGHSNLNISLDSVRERLHLVEAVRLDPAYVATVGKTYRKMFTRTVEGVEVLPLVVLDTKSAVLALDNENDNSEASAMISALKQDFDRLPVWIVGHVPKTSIGRNDVASLSSRGAGSTDGDGNQTMFLIREGERRYLVLGKKRFEPKWAELEITSYTAQAPALDEFGNLESIVMRWGIAAPPQQSRKEAVEQTTEQLLRENEATLRQDIRDAVELAWQAGNPLNREGIKAKSGRKHSEAIACLEGLLSERWLQEIFVPARERMHPRKSAFFVNLTTEEHEAVLSGGGLPAAKLMIPKSWKKAPVSNMPNAGHGGARNEVADNA